MLSAFGSPSGGAPPASPAPAPRAAEGVPPSTTQWGASKASGSIYTPQTGVANHTVREAVAKQGFLIKSSAGKKDSVSTAHTAAPTPLLLLAISVLQTVLLHTSALGIVHMTYWSALLAIIGHHWTLLVPNLTPDRWG